MAASRASVDAVNVGQDVGRVVAPQGRTRKRKRFQHGNYTGKMKQDVPPYPLRCGCRSFFVSAALPPNLFMVTWILDCTIFLPGICEERVPIAFLFIFSKVDLPCPWYDTRSLHLLLGIYQVPGALPIPGSE